MNDYDIKLLQRRVDFLEDNIRKQSSTNFNKYMWLIILSNLTFWIMIGHGSLKQRLNKVEAKLTPKNLNICYQRKNENIKDTETTQQTKKII